MGIKTALKVNKEEYDLIMFIRNNMPFGKCILTTHEGQPVRVEDIKKTIIFGLVEKTGGEDSRRGQDG